MPYQTNMLPLSSRVGQGLIIFCVKVLKLNIEAAIMPLVTMAGHFIDKKEHSFLSKNELTLVIFTVQQKIT